MMRTSFSLLLIALLAVATFAQKPNELSEAEKKAGWKLLFDGKTLNGWRGFHSDKVPAVWVIEDGCIKMDKDKREALQKGGDIITLDQYENFELSLEWKISKGGNSGIKYLVSETLPKKGSAISFEMQIIDDKNHPDAKAGVAGNRRAGSLYDLIPASNRKKLKPVGEFNQVRLIVKGNHIEHWLNGIKVVEFERESDALKLSIAKSKFCDQPAFGTFAKGHLLLQEHKDTVWFRNIKIRELK